MYAFARAPEKVRQDVIDGFVSVEGAQAEYGVVLDGALAIDHDATAQARRARS